jgi:hypothetical protein
MSMDKGHLSPEELSRSVVDEPGLAGQSRDHLKSCPVCRRERQYIVQQLDLIGKSARQNAPDPVRKIILPSAEGEAQKGWAFGWGLTLKLAAAAALLVLTVSWLIHFQNIPGMDQGRIASEMVQDEKLMTEISMLEEDSLPDAYQEISPETAADVDEDIFDFVVPISGIDLGQQGQRIKEV